MLHNGAKKNATSVITGGGIYVLVKFCCSDYRDTMPGWMEWIKKAGLCVPGLN